MSHRIISFIIVVLLVVTRVKAQQTSFKFDFGSGDAPAGYIKITPATIFTYQTGYGFNREASVEAVDRGGNAPGRDYITAKTPFYFSLKLPEGNYDIKLLLGDRKAASATTVRVECRRLMLENVRTKKGEIIQQLFTVHVRDSMIRDARASAADKVQLKPRELNYLHWDDLLTLEFNDSLPKICAMEISPNSAATTIFLAGNSTVVDQDKEPWAAWGQMFPRFLVPSTIVVANYAESGETLKAFEREKRLDKIWSMAKPGDYLFIEFTHNDQKPGANHLDPFTTYKETLKNWILEARKRRIVPVLITSMHRRNFDSSGHIVNTLLEYPEAMRQVAKEENVVLIDLNTLSKTLYEAWGAATSIKAFVHYPAHSFPNQDSILQDNTHFNPYGAYSLAACVVSSIRKQHLSIEKYIRKEIPEYDPGKPVPPEKFYWPQSPLATLTKPAGN